MTGTVRAWRGTDASTVLSTEWHDLVPRLLAEHHSCHVAEVGVWRGELSERILTQCPRIRRLWLVDPWHPSVLCADGHWYYCGPGVTQAQMDEALAEVRRVTLPYAKQVRILRLASVEGAKLIPERSLDAVLIDALHFQNTVMEDIRAWRSKLRPGGLMIGDDYSDYYPGVSIGVRAIFGHHHRVLGQTWWTIPDNVPPQSQEPPCSAACR